MKLFAFAADQSSEGPFSVPVKTAVLNCTTTAVWVSRERNISGYVTYVEALNNNHCTVQITVNIVCTVYITVNTVFSVNTVCTVQITVNNEIFVFCFDGHFTIVFGLAQFCAKKKTDNTWC